MRLLAEAPNSDTEEDTRVRMHNGKTVKRGSKRVVICKSRRVASKQTNQRHPDFDISALRVVRK